MPRGKKQKQLKRLSPIQLASLLAQFLLIRIGALPLVVVSFAISHIYSLVKNIRFPSMPALKLPRFSPSKPALRHFSTLPLPSSNHKLIRLPFGDKRGRPRKSPFLVFYLNRFKHFFKTRIPKKIKVATALVIVSAIFFTYTYFILTAAYQLPSPTRLVAPNHPLTTEFYDRNGNLLYRMYEGRNRTLVQLEELPPYLIQATLAIEDKNFYKHNGIDLIAILRAAYHNYQKGNFSFEKTNNLEGASTLTQQLIKNSLLTPEKTYTRKIKEIILAVWAETIYSKNEILGMYLNEAPYGGPAWGVEAASRTYFGKPAKDLTLAEAAFLAGLPASPTEFSPYGTKPELGLLRQKEVLRRMIEDKYISVEEAEKAQNEKLAFRPPIDNIEAPHFVFYVRDLLAKKYGGRVVSQGGLKIYTTLDLGLQKGVEKIVTEEISALNGLNVKNGAAMVTDPKTGQILAMVGSRDYFYTDFGNFNVTLAPRQPGSSIKPITYVTAFKKGYTPGNTVLDTPIVFSDEWGNSYAPVNYDGRFLGPVSIRTALASSLNVPAVRVLATIGVDPVVQTARELGITTFTNPKDYGLALTLGAAEVKMIEMMGVYGTFAQLGSLRNPTPILKVADSEGNVLEEYKNNPHLVLQPELAYLITHILSDNNARTPAFGPNSLLDIKGHTVAVKTGTTDNKRDNWTFGYTQDFVVGVWVGNNDNSPMHPSLTSGVTGATPIWNKIMKGLLGKHPSTAFTRPSGIIEVTVDGRRDLAGAGTVPKGLVRAKTDKEQTVYFDAFSSYATSSATVSLIEGTSN